MRRRIALAVAAPIAVVGSLAAHQLSYALQAPSPAVRAILLATTGHGYLSHLPMVIGVCVVTAALGVALELAHAWDRGGRAAGWQLALVAPLAFALQEHLERFVHTGALPTHLVLEPWFWFGLALQIPFALLAWGVAGAILVAARAVRAQVRRAGFRPAHRPAAGAMRPREIRPHRLRPVSTPLLGRAPPACALPA